MLTNDRVTGIGMGERQFGTTDTIVTASGRRDWGRLFPPLWQAPRGHRSWRRRPIRSDLAVDLTHTLALQKGRHCAVD